MSRLARCAANATRTFLIGRMKADDNARRAHESKQRILKLHLRTKDLGVPTRRSYNIWNEKDQRFNALQHVT